MTKTVLLRGLGLAAALVGMTIAGPSAAQAPATDALVHADVTKKPTDERSWTLNAGFTANAGNTQSYLLNAGSRFRLAEGMHAVTAEAQFNIGRSNVTTTVTDPNGGPDITTREWSTTARNINAKARYELYMTDLDALFAGEVFRWDTFAGLDSRFQTQLGYQRNIIRAEKHRFWSEAGYDLTVDNYDPESVDPNTDVVHAARLMVGYNNELNENVAVLTELEGLFNVEELKDIRLNYSLGLRSTISESLKADLSFIVRYDNVPVPGKEKTDMILQVNLIYALM